MTIGSEQTVSPTGSDGLRVPPAGKPPVAAPAAGYVGSVIALLLLGLGVVALRDGAVAAGWLTGQPLLTGVIDWIDGLGVDWWTIPVAVAAIVVGAWCVYAALRPRRQTAVAVVARSGVWIGRADLARLASHAAESVPGVLAARSSATLRTITVTARVTADDGLRSAVADAVRNATSITRAPLKIRVRTRTGAR